MSGDFVGTVYSEPAGFQVPVLANDAMHNGKISVSNQISNGSRSTGFPDALEVEEPPEPFGASDATLIAQEESSEGEHLYRDLKAMEFEAMKHPDRSDVLLQAPVPEAEEAHGKCQDSVHGWH